MLNGINEQKLDIRWAGLIPSAIRRPPLKYSMTAIDIYVWRGKDNRNKMQLTEFIVAFSGPKLKPSHI